eukprot:4663364-Prymnesium_polylepis.1
MPGGAHASLRVRIRHVETRCVNAADLHAHLISAHLITLSYSVPTCTATSPAPFHTDDFRALRGRRCLDEDPNEGKREFFLDAKRPPVALPVYIHAKHVRKRRHRSLHGRVRACLVFARVCRRALLQMCPVW